MVISNINIILNLSWAAGSSCLYDGLKFSLLVGIQQSLFLITQIALAMKWFNERGCVVIVTLIKHRWNNLKTISIEAFCFGHFSRYSLFNHFLNLKKHCWAYRRIIFACWNLRMLLLLSHFMPWWMYECACCQRSSYSSLKFLHIVKQWRWRSGSTLASNIVK